MHSLAKIRLHSILVHCYVVTFVNRVKGKSRTLTEISAINQSLKAKKNKTKQKIERKKAHQRWKKTAHKIIQHGKRGKSLQARELDGKRCKTW